MLSIDSEIEDTGRDNRNYMLGYFIIVSPGSWARSIVSTFLEIVRNILIGRIITRKQNPVC